MSEAIVHPSELDTWGWGAQPRSFMNRIHSVAARVGLLVLALAFAETGMAQIDTLMVEPEKDFRDLYKRAAASQFVVVGTVVRMDGIGERWTKDLYERIMAANDLSVALLGTLYSVQVDNTVCRQGDFRARSSASSDAPKTIYIFLPKNEPAWVDGQMREVLLPGERYLLFLVPLEQKTLDRWIKTYDLDPHRPYFRGEQHARGVVLLKAGGLGVLEKVTRLCDAVRPAEVIQKLVSLQKLEAAGDPILEKEAREAREKLQSAKAN
jgi:hypothetical protein